MADRKELHPPRFAHWMLLSVIPLKDRGFLLDDFRDVFDEMSESDGSRAAQLWYWRQAIKTVPEFFMYSIYLGITMLGNYIKIAFRNMKRQKVYSFINIMGLAVGMACCLLILLFVQDELSYDRYNEHADRIYRIAGDFNMGGQNFNTATICAPAAEAVKAEFPEIVETVRFRADGSYILRNGDISFRESRVVYADSTFFKLFTIPLLEGDPSTALHAPNTMIISESTSEKYFGNQNPVGKSLRIDNSDDFAVTGVYRDIPGNSHFNFDVIFSMASRAESRQTTWLSNNFNTYILLRENADPAELETKFPALLRKNMNAEVERFFGISYEALEKAGKGSATYYLQPLTDIHLNSDLIAELGVNSDIKYVYIFTAIALFILVIACINFVNLSTARSAGRATEVGVRKAIGSFRKQLVSQFLTESLVVSFAALVIAVFITLAVLPYFNALSGKTLMFTSLLNPGTMLFVIVVSVSAGLLAGLYPALYISAICPVNIFSEKRISGKGNGLLRSGLVVFQLTTSIVLVISTIVVYNQLGFIQNKKIGFNKEQVLVLGNTYLLDTQVQTFKDIISNNPGVVSATVSGYLPAQGSHNSSAVFPDGKLDDASATSMNCWSVDNDYIKTMGMNIVLGRDFSRDFLTDSSNVIINQAAVKQFGWDKPLERKLSKAINNRGGMRSYDVIGVVEDFHFESLRNNIEPLVLFLEPNNIKISVRIQTDDIAGIIGFIRGEWNKLAPGQPFEYSFLDDRFNNMYQAERKLGSIFSVFAALAIFIGCLGLLGLASYMAELKTKEIGIRKTLGASDSVIMMMLTREFVKWITVANIIAWPVGWYIMDRWLQNYAYRYEMGIGIFLLSGLIALTVALVTISYQALKASRAKPVDSLRYQ